MTDLFSPHRDAVVRSLERRFGNRDLAEDAVQEALAMAVASGETPANPKAWLHVVAHRRAVDALRGEREAPHSEPPEVGCASDTADVIVLRERVRSVLSALHTIPRRQRDALLLRTLEDRSYDEIGARLEVEPDNAKQLVSRARRSIRRRVAGLMPAPLLARVAELAQRSFEVATGTAAGRACAGLCVAGAFASLSIEAPVVRQLAATPAATAVPTPSPTATPERRRVKVRPRRTPTATPTAVRTAVPTPTATAPPVRTAVPTPTATATPSSKDAIVSPPTPTPTPEGYKEQIRELKRCPRTQDALRACAAQFRAWSIEQAKRHDVPKAKRDYPIAGSSKAS